MRQVQDRIDCPGRLRESIERLEGLPLRPLTAQTCLERAVQESKSKSLDGVFSRLEAVDPGWLLARLKEPAESPLALIADHSWWPSVHSGAAEALNRLWRQSVATSRAARWLAIQAADPDPSAVALAGLLHSPGLWALAALAPDRLADWFEVQDVSQRLPMERRWFGCGLPMLGRSLASRWGCPAIVSEAAWRLPIQADLLDTYSAQARLDPLTRARILLLHQALAWAERTPWALHPHRHRHWHRDTSESDSRLRWLMAETQALCPGSLTGNASIATEGLIRSAARSLQVQSQEQQQENLRLLDERDQLREDLEEILQAIHLREERAEEARRLAQLEALAEFSAGASHEMNNPLAVVVGRAQLLRVKLSDKESIRALDAIIAQAKRAHGILRDLMYVARPPSPRPRACLPDEILRQTIAGLASEAKGREVRLLGQTREPGPVAWADPDALRHLAEVLLRNALEASPSGGTVQVFADGDEQTLVWTVQNCGSGLSEVDTTHLLDPFYCGRQAGRGLGLGLPRVARYLQQVGGTIRWRSDPKHGTAFRVRLPIVPPPEPLESGLEVDV